ncbi:hypothetical protein MOQ_003838 [Trypanosoma cruzi marinkellei]|uniref:Phospholipid/glycerol acyltransferase domain-containing protein n=1 Tax=Trypanosoma cruzi marinkellei TaxID=85056 RepID=K2MZ01_TRYCR|nr:hypothetical protein MOQ_003838 [Trypanosoma cruzi marinkellei]
MSTSTGSRRQNTTVPLVASLTHVESDKTFRQSHWSNKESTSHGVEGVKVHQKFLRAPRVALPREACHPFFYNYEVSGSLLQWLKVFIVGLVLLPTRVVYALLLLALAWLFSVLTGFLREGSSGGEELQQQQKKKKEEEEQQQQQRRGGGYVQAPRRRRRCLPRVAMRWLTLSLGYWRIHRQKVVNYGCHADGSYAEAPIIVANHCTLQDGLLLLGEHNVLHVVGPSESGWMRVVALGDGHCIESHEVKSRLMFWKQQLKQQKYGVTRNDYHWPLLVFPETCYTNSRALIQFQTDVFAAGLPVQPLLVRHMYTHFDPSWCGAMRSLTGMLLRTMCQVYNTVELTYLPVYDPSPEEQEDAMLYAENVRRVMAHAMKVPTTQHNKTDVRLILVAHKLKLPIEAVNVEVGHPHFMGMSYERMEHMLCRFAAALRSRKVNSIGPKIYLQWRYRFCVPEGFMTLSELGNFLMPFGDYPLLLDRLLNHLSRHAAVRGIFIAFRDFLSAMYTEPLPWRTESSGTLQSGKEVYMDEVEEEEAVTFVLQRTFVLLLLAADTLFTQKKEMSMDTNRNFKPSRSLVPSSSSSSSSSSCMGGEEWGRTSTFIYGHVVRHPVRMPKNDGLYSMLTATAEDTMDNVVCDRHLDRDMFDVLCDILFIPHRTTMWRGASAKSSAQLAEEDALFAYIRSGANPGVVKSTDMPFTGEDNTKSYITLHSFLRFGRKHRATAEYFHACCEHFLLGDDLA